MLFRKTFLAGIRDGTVTLAFRRWRRPSVREGGTLLTAVGELHIGSVTAVAIDSISVTEARHAGYESREALLAELTRREDGEFYRIELGPLAPIPGSRCVSQRRRERRSRSYASGYNGWTLEQLERLGPFACSKY